MRKVIIKIDDDILPVTELCFSPSNNNSIIISVKKSPTSWIHYNERKYLNHLI